MREKSILSLLKPSFLVIVGGGIICAAATLGQAQDQAGPRQITLAERENTARENQPQTTKRNPQEVMAQVNEDLRQLHVLNANISTLAAATNQHLHYNSVIENVADIKKRSSRLSADLALPPAEKEKGADLKEAEKGELQPGLAALNKLIDSFLHNPIFKEAGAIDIQLATRARRDLEDIKLLSEKLRKNAEKRSKTSGKAQ